MRYPPGVRRALVCSHGGWAQQGERHRNYGREHAAAASRRGEEPCRHRDRRAAHVSYGWKPEGWNEDAAFRQKSWDSSPTG